jgi:citrate lyase gamma subunit
MKKIINYSGFRSINELDTTGTYLDRSREKYAQAAYPKLRKMFGKVFKDAPTTSGVDYGLKYEGEDYEFDLNSDIFYEWNVIFPDDFYKHFVPKGENPEEWKKDNKDIVVELMDNLNDIRIKAEGGLNRTHFPGGIPNDLKGLGLGYIIYEGLVRYLGYASSRPDASNAAQKVWSQIAKDPDFEGIVSNNMILVFRKDFEHKGEVLGKALDYLGVDFEEIEDNQDLEKFLRDHNIEISDELMKIDFMENFKENIAAVKRRRTEYNLRYEAESAARRLKESLFGDPARFDESELRAIKEKITEIREYMKDMSTEKLVDILKSNGIEVKNEQIESKFFMDKIESLLKQDFKFYINSRVRNQVGNAIKEMKDIIVKNLRLSVEGMEAIVKELQAIYDSKYKEILESQEDELDLKWVAEHTNFNNRMPHNLLIGTYGGKYTFKFEIGRQEYFKSVLIYDTALLSPTKIPLDIIQLFKYFIIEVGLKTATNTDAFVESKKADLEKMDILISKDYKWAGNAFTKLKIGQDIDNVVLKPIEHLELVKKLKLTDQAMKMKNAYKYLAKGLQKAYLEGGYAKALELYDTEVKKKLEYIDVDVFDDPDYGLFKDRRPDAKYSAQEHIERRLKAYKEIEDFNAAKARIQANIDAATNKVNSHIDKSAEAALAKINSRNATQAPTPKQVQVQKKAQEELEKKPIEKRSFIKRFMDFFN